MPEPLEPGPVIGPDEAGQQAHALVRGDVDGIQVDTAAASDRKLDREQIGGDGGPLLAGQHEGGVGIAPCPVPVPVAVAVDEQVQAGARTELEQVEPPSTGTSELEERRQ